MKCHNCGNEIPEESVFCGMCGARADGVITLEEPPVEPAVEPESISPEPVTGPMPSETVVESTDTVIETEVPETESSAEFEETEAPGTEYEHTEEFVIKHCPYCGAVLMSGAKFCSNCGNSIVVYERNMYGKRGGKIGVKAVIAAIAAAVVIIVCAGFLTNFRSIEGEWAVENSGGGFFDMFSEVYLDFDDDGTAVYYNGLFTARRYTYTYNRFTKVLTLKSVGRGIGTEDSRLHVEWIDPYTISIRELNMTLYRVDNIPYAYDDDEYSADDVVMF